MTDPFASYEGGLEAPATEIFDVTPSDSTDLASATRAINVAHAGDVRVTTVGGTTASVFIAAGLAFPIRAVRVHESGTTAQGIVGLV